MHIYTYPYTHTNIYIYIYIYIYTFVPPFFVGTISDCNHMCFSLASNIIMRACVKVRIFSAQTHKSCRVDCIFLLRLQRATLRLYSRQTKRKEKHKKECEYLAIRNICNMVTIKSVTIYNSDSLSRHPFFSLFSYFLLKNFCLPALTPW